MPFKLESTETLFPIPLWRYSVDNHEDLNRRLLEEIAVRRDKDPNIASSHRLGWQSPRDLFDRTEPAHAELAQIVQRVMVDALKSTSATTDWSAIRLHFNGWININPPRGYIGPHMHPSSVLSGSYYVDVGDTDPASGGAIEFVSQHEVTHLNGLIKAPMFTDKMRIQPKPGMLLLFPGPLLHWVLPNHTEKDRVTIAFNAAVTAKPRAGAGAAGR